MGLGVLLFEFGEGGMSVDGGGCYGLVTEELLYGFELGAMGEHCGGEGVAQHVGRTPLLRGDGAEGVVDHEAQLIVAHAAAAGSEEKGRWGLLGRGKS